MTAPKNIVFERIMINGKPAFFGDTDHPLTSFNKTWEDRSVVYQALTNIQVNNSGTLAEAVQKILGLTQMDAVQGVSKASD